MITSPVYRKHDQTCYSDIATCRLPTTLLPRRLTQGAVHVAAISFFFLFADSS
jgi:hypothetical protein